MNEKERYYHEEELEEPGDFDVRNVPDTRFLHIRLLFHVPKEVSDRVVDVVIEPDEPKGRRIRVTRGTNPFEKGVKLEIRG